MAMGWYVMQVMTGQERNAEKYIQTIIDDEEYSGILNTVKVPAQTEVEIRNGKKRYVSKKFLPGYILVEMDLELDDWRAVCAALRAVRGVSGFVGYRRQVKPSPISKEEVRVILQRSGDIKSDVKFQTSEDFAVGEELKIVSGPFESFTGRIDEVFLEHSKLRLMVGIFGRDTPVELTYDQVERVV